MDIALSAEDLAFRDEVRNFLDTEFDAEMQAHLKSRGSKGMVEWQQKLYAQGWVAPNWPVEHGGTGWTATQKYIWESCLLYTSPSPRDRTRSRMPSSA